MSSIKDVADMAGVSYTTVSHVINKTRPVSEEKAKRVEEAIKKLNYIPSLAARGLRKGRSMTIGVIDANMFDMFFIDVMRKTQSLLEKRGYSLFFSYSYLEEEHKDDSQEFFAGKEMEYLKKMLARNVDAIIINPINNDSVLTDFLKKVTIPVISFQRTIDVPNAIPVLSDDYAGGYSAVRHAVELGHRELAVVYGFTYRSHSAFMRRIGIKDAAKEKGIVIPKNRWVDGKYQMDCAYSATKELLELESPPSFIIYYSDAMAMSGIRAVRDAGLRIPEDISIIGYDDIAMADYSVPRLSTIRQDSSYMGEFIAELIFKKLGVSTDIEPDKIDMSGATLLPEELVQRESTARYQE